MSEVLQNLNMDEQEAIGKAVVLMLQQCPFISVNSITLKFEDMAEDTIGVFPEQGTVYLKKFLSGAFIAQYAFFLRYRVGKTDDEGRIGYEDMLENVARWLEKSPVICDGTTYQLAEYPALTDKRVIDSIVRTSNAYNATQADDGTIDYQVYLQLRYQKG